MIHEGCQIQMYSSGQYKVYVPYSFNDCCTVFAVQLKWKISVQQFCGNEIIAYLRKQKRNFFELWYNFVHALTNLKLNAHVQYICSYTHNCTFLAEAQHVHAWRKGCPLRANSFTAGIVWAMYSIHYHVYAALHTSCFCDVLVASTLLVARWGGTAFRWPSSHTLDSSNNRSACWDVHVRGMMAVVGYAGLCNTGNLVSSEVVSVILKYCCIRR